MAPLLPVITLAISLISPLAVHAFGEDLNDYGAQHRADMDRAHERQMQEYRAENQAAEYRNEQAAREMEKATTYSGPSWEPSTKSFLFSDGNDPSDMKLCTSSKTSGVSCF